MKDAELSFNMNVVMKVSSLPCLGSVNRRDPHARIFLQMLPFCKDAEGHSWVSFALWSGGHQPWPPTIPPPSTGNPAGAMVLKVQKSSNK